eukprot:09335.XXX_203597_202326_1 [CDS] Oithona nana genome sequencing.
MLQNLCTFLKNYQWLFNFSNLDILQEHKKWPQEWMTFFQIDVPFFVEQFIQQRNDVVRDFETRYVETISNEVEVQPRMKKGLSPKKEHEVVKFGSFINSKLSDCDRIIDVGSGAGHLERYLLEVWKKSDVKCEICGIENCQKQVKSVAAKLEDHPHCFKKIEEQVGSAKNRQALIGLHACGDLTNTMLSWFVSSNYFSKLAVVSCCYHKMSTFPISDQVRNILQEDVYWGLTSTYARRLGAQDPFSAWRNKNFQQHLEHAKSFGRRAILQTLTSKNLKKNNRHGIRNSGNISNEEFIAKVEQSYEFETDNDRRQVLSALHKELKMDFNWLEVFSGFQAILQLPLEYLMMLDKLLYLNERLPEKNPKLLKIFDETISPRCILIFCD